MARGDMDIDVVDVAIEDTQVDEVVNQNPEERPAIVEVDGNRPFDVEAYISAYSSRTALFRLLYILEFCPSLANETYPILEKQLKEGRDISLYQSACELYNKSGMGPRVDMDHSWAASTEKSNNTEKNKLEVELKTYTANSIKESIRMAHRDLGNFYRAIGDDGAALKNYVKARENCSPALGQPMLDICLSLIELAIEQRTYSTLPSFIFKAETALDAMFSVTAGSASASKLAHKKTGPAPSAEREKYQVKLDVATGLSQLGQGQYEKAAHTFLRASSPNNLEDWNGKIISPSDIAIYGTLCALATLSRSAINAQLLQSDTFSIFLEHEPYVRELLSAYMSSKFKLFGDILEKYTVRHRLDIHLGPHIINLQNLIRDRALVMYFQPFATVKLERMAAAFGMPIDKLESLAVHLIRSGKIQGRVDSKNKILKANVVDQRAALFDRAVQAGAHIESTNRKLLLRMKLQQADLVVRPPRNQNQQQGQAQVGGAFSMAAPEAPILMMM